jgi:amidase
MEVLWRKNAAEVASLVKAGKVSAVEATQAALDRLEQVNGKLNAVVIQTQDDAFRSAHLVDQAIQRGEDPGLLAGVPVTVKVNIDQAGYANTNGLKMQGSLIAEYDSPVVTNFRKSGAIIIGRTNTPAFSLRWFTRNQLHGHTLNPHNSSITPGGSSGGAASATAAGIGAIGHGTDIGGAIRYPAYACGLQGFALPLGVFPHGTPQAKIDTLGPN